MKLLAVDTSSLACSVALKVGDIVIEQHIEQEREHTRRVVNMITEVLRDGACTLSALDALVLGRGPGSFIGLRIATSLLKGLAFSRGLKIVSVSSMLAVAEEVFDATDAGEVVVAQDAHMQQVYLGRYRLGEHALAADEECLHAIGPIAMPGDRDAGARYAAGAGWDRYPALWAQNEAAFAGRADVLYPRARYLLPQAERDVAAGRLQDPRDVEPAYLRHEVASPPRQA